MTVFDGLYRLAQYTRDSEPDLIADVLPLLRDELGASEAYLVYGADGRFRHFSSGGELDLSDTQLWFVHRELTSGAGVCGFRIEGARVVDFRRPTGSGACQYVASLLPTDAGSGRMAIARGPYPCGPSAEQWRFLISATPALGVLLGRRIATARAARDQRDLSTLASISRVISHGEDLGAMLSSVASTIATVTSFNSVTIDLIDDAGRVELRCVNYELPEGRPDRWMLAKDRPDPVRDCVVSTRRAVISPDATNDLELPANTRRFLARALMRSIALLPLIARDQLLGVISFASQGPKTLSEYELEFLEGLADQVASAIDGVRLFEAGRKSEAALRESEQSFRLLFADNPHPMWVFDRPSSAFLEVNTAAVIHYGYSRGEFLSMSIEDIRPADDLDRLANVVKAKSDRHDGEWRHLLKDGQVIDVRIRAHAITFAAHDAMLVVAEDITERKRAQEAQARLTSVVEATTDLVSVADRDQHRVYLNRAGRRMLGIEETDKIAGDRITDHRPEWAREIMLSEAIPASIRDGAWSGDLAYIDNEGAEIPVSQVLICHKSPAGEVEFFSTVARDMSERKRIEAQLMHLADHDALTGLFNRRRLGEELDRALVMAKRRNESVAVLLIDVDQFKDVNDSCGHIAGDELLVGLGNLLQGRVRATDVLARQGGDEFVLVIPGSDADEAQTLGAELVRCVGGHSFAVAGSALRLTVSIGLAVFPTHATTSGELLSRADLAMYQAKERGRNQLCMYSTGAGWQRETDSRLDWYNRIRDALENERFVLLGQPILDLHTRRITRYELLLRMRGKGNELIPPGAFLDTAERSGLIKDIDRWVSRRAIQLLAEDQNAAGDIAFEVNLSGKAFGDPDLLEAIRKELAATKANPHNLIFEVTESAAIANINDAREFITTLKALGARFALDDFGVGFSSFSHLKHLPVDYLKIDGSFIRDLATSSVDQHLVRAMVGLAGALGMATIAEYVNDEQTVQLLEAYDVDYAQGYYIGRPAPLPVQVEDREAA